MQLVIATAHPEGYDRDLFHHWIDTDHDCQDTRTEVLITESNPPVSFTDQRDCAVSAGTWTDQTLRSGTLSVKKMPTVACSVSTAPMTAGG